MRNYWAVLRGATRAEYRMQIRRAAMWLAFALFAIFSLPFKGGLPDLLNTSAPHLLTALCQWSVTVNFVLMLCLGFFMADRLPRDRVTRVDETLVATAGNLGARCLGKFAGSLAATMAPLSMFFALGVLGAAAHTHSFSALGLGLLTYLTLVLPGALVVGAFSLLCTAFIWPPLYQFLFACYWVWGNAFPPYPHFPIPTLSGTVLTPVGSAISAGLYGVPAFGLNTLSLAGGVASLILLPCAAALALAALPPLLRWQAARQ